MSRLQLVEVSRGRPFQEDKLKVSGSRFERRASGAESLRQLHVTTRLLRVECTMPSCLRFLFGKQRQEETAGRSDHMANQMSMDEYDLFPTLPAQKRMKRATEGRDEPGLERALKGDASHRATSEGRHW